MKLIALLGLAAAVLVPLRADGANRAGTAGALPPHAVVDATVAIPGDAHVEAVAYSAGKAYAGVVSLGAGGPRLVWSRALPFVADRLSAPGESGLFTGFGIDPRSGAGEFFAFDLGPGGVTSAISGHSSGILTGDEGVKRIQNGVIVRHRDRTHVGSVPYQILARFELRSGAYSRIRLTRRPDYPGGKYPAPNAVAKTAAGDTILLRLEVADTEVKRETGLMNRKSLDPDSGMIFVWTDLVQESFWMENTYIPLTVAFLSPNGTVEETQDMQPLTTDLHTPAEPYQYAIEANLGFFAAHGIKAGDDLRLNLSPPTTTP